MSARVLPFPARPHSPPAAAPLPKEDLEELLQPTSGPLAPADCVTVELLPGGELARLVASDQDGTSLAELVLPCGDTVSIRWFARILRLWLAWRHQVSRIRLVRVDDGGLRT